MPRPLRRLGDPCRKNEFFGKNPALRLAKRLRAGYNNRKIKNKNCGKAVFMDEAKGVKKGLILEGGAMRGVFTAGVTDYLMEKGVTFDGMIGVSARRRPRLQL